MSRTDPFHRLDAEARKLLQKISQPDWVQPMLATLTKAYFDHPDWIFEPKWDGERCLVFKDNQGMVKLFSRNHKPLNDTYPELEWTRDGKLRHPTFLGLREDKDPIEIVKES